MHKQQIEGAEMDTERPDQTPAPPVCEPQDAVNVTSSTSKGDAHKKPALIFWMMVCSHLLLQERLICVWCRFSCVSRDLHVSVQGFDFIAVLVKHVWLSILLFPQNPCLCQWRKTERQVMRVQVTIKACRQKTRLSRTSP